MCLAMPARVVEVSSEGRARIELGGVAREISIELLDDVQVGDYVVVHVGHALSKLDPEEAAKTLACFQEIAEASEA